MDILLVSLDIVLVVRCCSSRLFFTARSCPRSSNSSLLLMSDVVVDWLLMVVIDLRVLRVLLILLHIDSLVALGNDHSTIHLDRLVVARPGRRRCAGRRC